jgi:cytochrome P450
MTQSGVSAGDLYYDPFDFDVDLNAQPIWRRLRDEAPVYWNEKYEFFALSRYDDVLRVVVDTDTFTSTHSTSLEQMGPDRTFLADTMMIYMDPPQHTWHRKVVSRAFTPRTMAALEDRMTRLANGLLDQIDGRDEFDFVEDYGGIIPPTVILALLGFPEGFEEEWRRGVDASLTLATDGEQIAAGHPVDAPAPDELIGADGTMGMGALFQILPELVEARRKTPEDDLMSVLANTDLDEDGQIRKLNDAEIFSFVLLLSAAGTETVARLLGWAGSLLAEYPEERAKLVADPSLIPNAVEECLRYEAPSPVNGRWVTADTEFHGQVIPKDSKLLMINGSGNRDERHFPDPDRFDVTRQIDRHLSFGYGAHFCVGAALARMEGVVALRELLKRYPTWAVDRDRTTMVHTSTVRGFAKLPVHL